MLETQILKLLENKLEVSLREVASALGFHELDAARRKTIQRMLKALVKRGVLEARGVTRARVYSLTNKSAARYLEQPARKRTPVGYNQDFLRSYQPNDTEYLHQPLRAELLRWGRPSNSQCPAGTYARNILNRLLIDLSWNSSRLEGNTYSLLETKRLIELGESAPGKDWAEAQMILNHKRAIEYIVESCDEPSISSHTVYSIHALLSDNLLGDPSASGRIRQLVVGISGSAYLPLENPHLIKECFDLVIQKLNLIQDPFEQSFFSWIHLSYLQAFEDVNKRTARLVANIPLIKKNLCPLSFTDIERQSYAKAMLGVYEKNDISIARDLYRWAYERSSKKYSAMQQNLGEPDAFRLKNRETILNIVRSIILEKTPGSQVVSKIHSMIDALKFPVSEAALLFEIAEREIASLHEGNVARFQIRPSEFQAWQAMQEF